MNVEISIEAQYRELMSAVNPMQSMRTCTKHLRIRIFEKFLQLCIMI